MKVVSRILMFVAIVLGTVFLTQAPDTTEIGGGILHVTPDSTWNMLYAFLGLGGAKRRQTPCGWPPASPCPLPLCLAEAGRSGTFSTARMRRTGSKSNPNGLLRIIFQVLYYFVHFWNRTTVLGMPIEHVPSVFHLKKRNVRIQSIYY
jgi:hypothetical protein